MITRRWGNLREPEDSIIRSTACVMREPSSSEGERNGTPPVRVNHAMSLRKWCTPYQARACTTSRTLASFPLALCHDDALSYHLRAPSAWRCSLPQRSQVRAALRRCEAPSLRMHADIDGLDPDSHRDARKLMFRHIADGRVKFDRGHHLISARVNFRLAHPPRGPGHHQAISRR